MPNFSQFRNPRPNIRRAPVVGNGDVLSPQQVTTFNASQGMQRNQAFLESRQQPAPTAPRQAPVSRYAQVGAAPKAQPGVATTGKPISHIQRADGALIPVAAISGDRALINTGKHYVSPSTGKRYVTDPASATGMRDIGTEADEIAAKQAAAQAKAAAKAQVEATKAAEKGADEATKLAHAQKANEFLAQGRAFYHDKVTGEPRAKTSDEEWKAAQAEKGAKLQEAAATKTRRAQLAKLEFDAAQVNIKDKELDDADEAVASAKESIAAARTQAGMTEEDAYTKPFDDAELSTPQGAALTAAEAKKKELAAKIATRDALKQQIAEAKLRIENPEAYAQVMAEKVKGEAPEALDAREKESAAQIEATKAEITAKKQKLDAEEQRLAQSLAIAQKRYDEAKTTGNPAILSTAGEALQEIEAEAQAFEEKSQALRDEIATEVDEVNRDVQHLGIVSTEKASRRKNAIDDTANAFESALPGMGTELRSVLADGEARTKALRAKYKGREDAPEAKAAFEALQSDISGKTKLIEQQVRDSTTEKQSVRTAAGIAASKFQQGEDKLTKESPTGKFGAQFTMSQAEWNAAQAKTQEGGQARKLEAIKAAGLDPKNKEHVAAFDDAAAVSGMAPIKSDLTKPLKAVSADTVRTLSDGSLAVNPSLIHNADRYLEAVELSDGTPEAKADAVAALPGLQLGTAKALLPALKSMMDVPGLESFAKWTAANKPEGDETQQADAYLKAMQARGYWSKLVDSVGRNAIAGLAYDLPAMIVGTAGLLTGSQTLSELAGESTIGGTRLTQTIGAEGGESDLSTKILAQTARMAGPMAAQVLLTRGLMGPVTGGAMSVGQKAAIYGGAAAQTAGLQYAGTYQAARDAGKSHGEAWLQTAPYAIASGLVTAMLTAAGGSTGFEKLMQKGGGKALTAGNTFWSRLKAGTGAITKEAAAEIPEELPDELFSQISEALANDPDADITQVVAQFIKDAPALIGSVALMGGAGGVPDARRAFKGEQDAGTTPDGLLPEDLAGIEASIKAFAPTAPEAIQSMPAAIRTGPKNQLPSEITAKARAAMGGIAKVASGEITKLSDLTDTQLRGLGYARDKKGQLVQATKDVPPLVYVRTDKKGVEQLVITDEARTWLQGALPDLAIGQSEAERIQAIENPKPKTKPKQEMSGTRLRKIAQNRQNELTWKRDGKAGDEKTGTIATNPRQLSKEEEAELEFLDKHLAEDDTEAIAKQYGVKLKSATTITSEAGKTSSSSSPSIEADQKIAGETFSSLVARTKGNPKEYEKAQSARTAAAKRIMASLKKGDVIEDTQDSGVGDLIVESVSKDGKMVFVQGVGDPISHTVFMAGTATDAKGNRIDTPASAIRRKKPVAETAPVAESPATEAAPAQVYPTGPAGAVEGGVIPQASPDRQAKVDSLRAQGGDVVVVQDEAAAEALIGAPLVNKGRRGVTTRVNGKPTVVLIQSNMDGDSRSVDALLDEELHHAATLMVMDESPDLAAAAEQEAAAITKGDVIHSDFQKLSAKGRVVEAAAAYASGKWKPGKQSKIKAMVDAIVNRIAKALNITTKEAKPLAVDAIRRLATEAEAKIAPTAGETTAPEVDTKPAKGGELIAQADTRMRAVAESFAFEGDRVKARAAIKAVLDGLRRYNGHIPIVLTDDPNLDFAWLPNESALAINPETAIARFAADATDAKNAAAQATQFFRHELIHKFVVEQLGNARVMDIWNQLPPEVQSQVQQAYSVRLLAKGQTPRILNQYSGGHEYYRAMLEAMKDGTMTEQVIGQDLADKWRKFLDDVLSLLRDLRKQFASIKSESARNDLIKQVDQDIRLVSDALDAFEKSISPGAEPAQTQNTEAGSTSGKPVDGSSTTVATPVSRKREKKSSAKKEPESPESGVLEMDEAGNYITKEPNGSFKVWRAGITNASLAGTIGFKGEEGLRRAKERLAALTAEKSAPPTPAEQAPEQDEGDKALADAFTGLFASPTAKPLSQADLPKDRRDAMMKAASVLVDVGVKSPAELAQRLDKLAPNGALRQYTRAFWRLMTGFDSTLEENPHWPTVYAELDQPAEVQEDQDEANRLAGIRLEERFNREFEQNRPKIEALFDEEGETWAIKNQKIAKPGGIQEQWTPDELKQMIAKFRAAGLAASNMGINGNPMKATFGLFDSDSRRMFETVQAERAAKATEAAKREAQKQDQVKKRGYLADADQDALQWMNQTFGEDFANEYNKKALSDFITGKAAKFSGMVSQRWTDGVKALGAIADAEKGTVDFAAIKKAYNASKAVPEQGAAPASNSVPVSEQYMNEINRLLRKKKAAMIAGNGDLVDSLEDQIEQLRATVPMPTQAPASANEQDEAISLEELGDELHALGAGENTWMKARSPRGPKGTSTDDMPSRQDIEDLAKKRLTDDEWQKLSQDYEDGREVRGSIIATEAAPASAKVVTPEMIASKVEELLRAPTKTTKKPAVAFGSQTEERAFKSGFEAATQKQGKMPPPEKTGLSPKDRKWDDAWRKGWASGQTFVRSLPDTPATAEAKVEEQVQTIAATEGQRDAKEIKSDIVAALEKAMAERDPANVKLVTFQIPGDGTFKIYDSADNIKTLMARVKRLPTKIVPANAPSVTSDANLQSLAASIARASDSGDILAWVTNAANADEWAMKVVSAVRAKDAALVKRAEDRLAQTMAEPAQEATPAEESPEMAAEPKSPADLIRQHLDADDADSALAIFDGMTKDEINKTALAVFGRGFYNNTKAEMLTALKQWLPDSTKSVMTALAKQSAIASAKRALKTAKENQDRHAEGILGMPTTEQAFQSVSDAEGKDPHGIGKEAVAKAWQKEVDDAQSKLDELEGEPATPAVEETAPEAVEEKPTDVQQEFKDSIKKDFTEFSATFKTSTGNVHDVRVTKRTTNAQITNRLAGMFSKLGKADEVVEQARSFVDEWNRWHSITGNVSGREVMVRNAKDLAKNLPSAAPVVEETAPLQASPTAPARPIASVIQSFEAAFPTFSTYMDENQTPAARKEALRQIIKAESADVQAWREFANLDPEQALPEDAEAIREAKELLPEVEKIGELSEVVTRIESSGVEMFASEKNGIIRLSKIIVPKADRGKGVGTQAMQGLIRYADATNQQIALTPSSDFGGSKTRLEKFYRGLGFRAYKGYAVQEKLIRDPESKSTPPAAPKVSIPDIHAAFVQAKRQQGTDSPTIRAVFDAAKSKNPRLSRQEFVSAIRNGHYTGLVTLRDGQGSIHVGGKGAMSLLPITDAEIIDAAENATETPEAILADWAATEDVQQEALRASPTNPQNPNTTEIYELRQTLDAPPDVFPIPPERLSREAESLLRWATENGRIIDESAIRDATNRHDGLGGGEEHDVWLPSQAGGRVVKLTKGKLWGIQHSLARYLDTLAESNNRFGDDIRLEGVVIRDGWPHILISQPFYEGSAANQKEIDAYFTDAGYGPFRNLDAMYTNAAGDLMYDAFGRNVFKLADGSIMPIDVQVKVAIQKPLQASPTSSRDATYLQAVSEGDMEKAQRMVDAAAKAAGYNVGPVIHGTKKKFTVFNKRKIKARFDKSLGFHFTSSLREAVVYATDLNRGEYFGRKGGEIPIKGSENLIRAFLKTSNPLAIDTKFPAASMELDINTSEVESTLEKAASSGSPHDAIIVNSNEGEWRHQNVVVFDPNQIKSADPVTRDERGRVIPLSQRFNSESDSILYASPTPRNVANQASNLPGARDAWSALSQTYEDKELETVSYQKIEAAIDEVIAEPAGFDRLYDQIVGKMRNGIDLSLEEDIARRMIARVLWIDGNDNPKSRTKAKLLFMADMREASETARKLGSRVDKVQTPQQRLDNAMRNILSPSSKMVRERLVNVWSGAEKLAAIRELERRLASTQDTLQRERAQRELDKAKARQDQNEVMEQLAQEDDAKVDAILKRQGMTQNDLFLSVDDRYAMQEAVLEMTRAHMGQQSEKHKKAIEMSVRGYSDAAISKETGLPVAEVSNTAEHFRNVVAKQAIAKDVQAGGTFSKIVQQGKKLISWILQASPTAPLGNMVAKGTPTAAAVAAQIQAILNASIPTKGQRNAMSLHAATSKGKNGQNVKVFVPYDPSDWKQVYRTARELSTREATWLDKGYEYWINGILSGPQTHVVNTASNLLSTTWAYGPQWFAEATANVLIRNPESPQFGEFRHVFAGFWKGIMPAVRNFALAWSSEADPIEHQYLDKPVTAMFQGGNLDKVVGIRPSIGFGGRIVRMPGRFLIAQDAFAKTLIMHAETAAMAYRLGKKQGLSGAALENFMASQIATHGSESWQHAFEKSVELTFQDENDITKAVESVSNALKRAKVVGFLFKFLLPFVRTPTNIYRAGIRKAGGSAGVLLWRLGKSGYYAIRGNSNEFRSYREGKMVKDVSETVMALVLWYFIMGMSEGDDDDNQKAIEITGSRPFGVANAGERASQLRQEGGSNLIIIRKNPLTGEKLAEPLRLPYGRYEPIALAVSTLVDGVREFKEWARLKPQDRTTNALAGSITKHIIAQAKDKTFLQGISGFMDFLEDMGGKNLSLKDIAMKNLMNGAIPNLIRQPWRLSSDTIADSKKPGEVLGSTELARSLGIGEAKINEAGKPVQRGGNAVTRVLFPVPSAPSTSLFDSALKKWNATNPGQTWNPDPLGKADWYVYDPKQGSQKGKHVLTNTREISLFEHMVGGKFASLAARALLKEGYKPGQPVTPKMFEAIKDARTEAITKTRQRHPSEFRSSKP